MIFGWKRFVLSEFHSNSIRVISHFQDGFSCNSICCCFCFFTSVYRELFHHIRVLEASHQTEANLLSSCKLSCCRSFCWIHSSNRTRNVCNTWGGPSSNSSNDAGNILNALHPPFSSASVFSLVLISLERAYALIWPLRHRASSTKTYIYSVIFVWIAVLSVGVVAMLAAYDHLDTSQLWVALCCVVLLALITICISYLAIRKKLTNPEVSAIGDIHNKQNALEQNTKLSRTLFIVIAVSLGCWFPSILAYPIHSFCSNCLPGPLIHVCGALQLVNSLVNPIIYCFRIPIFRETLKRMKVRKHSVNYSL